MLNICKFYLKKKTNCSPKQFYLQIKEIQLVVKKKKNKRIKKVMKIEKLDFKRFKKKIVILIKIFILISE